MSGGIEWVDATVAAAAYRERAAARRARDAEVREGIKMDIMLEGVAEHAQAMRDLQPLRVRARWWAAAAVVLWTAVVVLVVRHVA